MNLTEHQELWNNIQQFALDEPNTTITFSKKLADQQRWSAIHTQRVIEEYRKFIFLCCISPNGASPSKAVDEVWHLHLTYTQSYWNAFCKNTLGKDIHHYPSTGGTKEDHKHTDWYAETLRLYESVFGTKPPVDIWPPPVDASQPVAQVQPVDVSLPALEQQYRIGKEMRIIIAVLLLLPFGINYIITGIASPFSLKGPPFLLFYAIFVVAAIIAHYLLRKDRFMSMKKGVDGWSIGNMTIFQLTHIVYGKERAVQTSLVDLYRRGLISVDDNNRKIVVHRNNYQAPEKEENPLIPALLIKDDGSSVYYTAITDDWYNQQSFEHPVTEKLFRLADQKGSGFERYLVVLIALFIGLARVMQGWLNDRPVVFLFLEIIALMVIAGIISYKFSTNELLNNKLKEQLLEKAGTKQLHADEVINDYALNGPRVLDWLPASLMLASMFTLFPVSAMATTSASGWGNSNSDTGWDSGSSGSSCSGGGDSSCGSGGGCGGCGGGGGD